MSSLQHILATDPGEPCPTPSDQSAQLSLPPTAAALPVPTLTTTRLPKDQSDDPSLDTPTPKTDVPPADEKASPAGPTSAATASSNSKRNAGNVSSVYTGNKIKHLKKEDGIPLWRKDIQYDFLRLVFYDPTVAFTKYSDGSKGHTFAEIYIDAMAKSSKCSKILKEKLLQDQEGAICMAMVCLLVNVGRMNTTLNFFPEMRAQLRTYHSIPALQAHQDPNAYKQLQDAPRLKSILKGATEDEPQPSTMEEIKAATLPRTNPVNLVFVMSQYAPKISEVHFQPPRDFFDLVMRGSLSSASRAKAFLWLVWWYLESDFSYEDSQRNPFGPGQYAEGEEGTGVLPLKVPALESLTEEQAAMENVDAEEEKLFGEVKRKERIAILASEPSPAMTALKRARKERELERELGRVVHGYASDDDASEPGWNRRTLTSAGRVPDAGSEYTRSPSPRASQSFQALNVPAKAGGDMRINNLLNDETPLEASPPHASSSTAMKRGPGRGNWRRNKGKDVSMPLAVRGAESSHHVPLLPNTVHLNFVNEGPHAPIQPATPSSGTYGPYSNSLSHLSPEQSTKLAFQFQAPAARDHIPTPSYQAQKRHRGVTQHQTAVISHRKQQIEYTLDRRIRKLHVRARDKRENEGSVLRAWKRIRLMPTDYDSEEEAIKLRKAKERAEKDEDWRAVHRGKENVDLFDEHDHLRRPRVLLAGFARVNGEAADIGEEARTNAQTFMRAQRRLERWQEANPGDAMIRRREMHLQGLLQPLHHPLGKELSIDQDGVELFNEPMPDRRAGQRRRSGTGRTSELRGISASVREDQRADVEPDDDDGGGELDEEDRELLGEVDADESEEDEDEEMDDE